MMYKLLAKYMNNDVVSSYQIQSADRGKLKITPEQLYFLIGEGKVKGWELHFVNGKAEIYSDTEKINTYTEIANRDKDRFRIIKEVVKDNKTCGFIIQDTTLKEYYYSIDVVHQYVANGYIQNVYIDEDNSIHFRNDSELYNLAVIDADTSINMQRYNIFLKRDEIKRGLECEINYTPIGEMESIAYSSKIKMLCSDRTISTNSKIYQDLHIIDISKHSIRIANNSTIIDIRDIGEDILKFDRSDIFNMIAVAIQRFDAETHDLCIKLFNEGGHELASYNYKLR